MGFRDLLAAREELGVNLAAVEGTGANGRITVGDVENAAREEGRKAG